MYYKGLLQSISIPTTVIFLSLCGLLKTTTHQKLPQRTVDHFDPSSHPKQECDEVKNSMGLLQRPRVIAWTTKSPIRGNHWVPFGCKDLLGSGRCQHFSVEGNLEGSKFTKFANG